jgi:putative ATPase
VAEAEAERGRGRSTVLFVDEIHRFNRAQQDAFLPHVERGTVILVGATTENPSFELNAALLSRCRVVTLRPLTEEEIASLVDRAVASPHGLAGTVTVSPEARQLFARYAWGDARRALNALEVAAAAVRLAGRDTIAAADAEEALQHKALVYDKAGEEHYNVVSAFIKSLRGSDPDAAVYYLTRMLEAGEDPRFLLRRMVIFASEDVGNADPLALLVATGALQAVELVGLPEGVLNMSQAAIYLALAPKSNTALTAWAAARRLVKEKGPLPVPLKLRNAPTKLMEGLGYGSGYRYPHDFEGHYLAEEYLPDEIRGERIVKLSESGREKALAERLAALRERKKG